MKKGSITLALKLAWIICVLLVGFGSAQAAEKKPILAFLPGTLQNASQAYAAKMFEKYGSDYGFDVIILDSPNGDVETQIGNVDKCIAQGVKVLVINPNDIVSIVPSLKRAKENGIVISLFSSDLLPQFSGIRDIFVGVDDTMAGEIAAKAFLDKFPNGAKIVEVGGQDGHDAQIKRTLGFHNVIDKSNIEILMTQNCKAWSTEDAKKVMEDLVAIFNEDIEGVFCHWDNGATGVIEALDEAGIENVFIVGVDGCSNGFQQVLDGKQSVTIAQSFENIAKRTMERSRKILSGETIEAVNIVPLETISKDNINSYEMPEW